MKAIKKTLAIATLAAATPLAAQAVELSGNVTMATDYVFRGFSQTSEKGAIQGGFDAGFDSGFYLGTWASNVDFGSEVTSEMDFYGGYAFDITDSVNLDLTAIYFYYAGDEAALNYQEYVATLSFGDFSFGLVYSPEYFGDGGPDALVYNLDYGLSLTDTVGLSFHVGMTDTDDDTFFADSDTSTDDSYLDWSVGISKTAFGVDFGLTYYDTDIDDEDLAEGRVVFSVSKSL